MSPQRVACAVCVHPRLTDIDAALRAGESVRDVASAHGLASSTVGRHRQRHVFGGLALADAETTEAVLQAQAPIEPSALASVATAAIPTQAAEAPGWPPPVTAATVWRRVPVGPAAVRRFVDVRRVRLWGKTVELDAAGRVWCDGCHELLEPSALLVRANGHRPAPDGVNRSGQVWSTDGIPDPDDERYRSESQMDRVFRLGAW